MTAAYETAGCLLLFYPATPDCNAAKLTAAEDQTFSSRVSFTEPGWGEGDSSALRFYTRSKVRIDLCPQSVNVLLSHLSSEHPQTTCTQRKWCDWLHRLHVLSMESSQSVAHLFCPEVKMSREIFKCSTAGCNTSSCHVYVFVGTHTCVCMTRQYLKDAYAWITFWSLRTRWRFFFFFVALLVYFYFPSDLFFSASPSLSCVLFKPVAV